MSVMTDAGPGLGGVGGSSPGSARNFTGTESEYYGRTGEAPPNSPLAPLIGRRGRPRDPLIAPLSLWRRARKPLPGLRYPRDWWRRSHGKPLHHRALSCTRPSAGRTISARDNAPVNLRRQNAPRSATGEPGLRTPEPSRRRRRPATRRPSEVRPLDHQRPPPCIRHRITRARPNRREPA